MLAAIQRLALEGTFELLRRVTFAGVHYAAVRERPLPAELPLLLVANHTSWWDGYFVQHVARLLRPDAEHAVIISGAELERHRYLEAVGAIGVNRSVGSIRALSRDLAVRRARLHARLVVSVFPQGRIWPSTRRPLNFHRGVMHFANALAPVAGVPGALHVEPLATRRPHAFALAGTPRVLREGAGDLAAYESAVTATLDMLHDFLATHGEDAARCWSGAFSQVR